MYQNKTTTLITNKIKEIIPGRGGLSFVGAITTQTLEKVRTLRQSGLSLAGSVWPVWRYRQSGQSGRQQSGQSGRATMATVNRNIFLSG